MTMNKCTLLIDGNWLLRSRFSVIGKGFEKDASKPAKEHAIKELVELMSRSINVMLNRFKVIDNLILVTDGGSWRKDVEKPKLREEVTYKGNREVEDKYDWTAIWSALKTLSNNFVKNGITYSCTKNVEGDDWIWYWSRVLNERGTNCIIWSSDNDLKQLVQHTEHNTFTAWYNDRNGMFLPQSLSPAIDDIDFFMSSPTYQPVLENLKSVIPGKIKYVLPDDIILSKIICGDAGDNILPVASYTTTTIHGTRHHNITEKIWSEIRADLNIKLLDDLLGNEKKIATYICNHKKFQKYNLNVMDVTNLIIYNTKLVWLHKNTIPHEYIDEMEKCEYKDFDIKFIKNNFKVLCNMDKEVEDLFDEVEDLFD